MTNRLAGLETEYAIRFTPEADSDTPNNAEIYAAIMAAVKQRVHVVAKRAPETTPDGTHDGRAFVENGGAFNYEALSLAPGGGLLEGATPECRSPEQLLLYQAAQDRLLAEALPDAEQFLAQAGYAGKVGLLKNCRDGFDHLYGAQDNYEVDIASGWRLFVFRTLLILFFPFLAAWTLATWSFIGIAIILLVVMVLPVGLLIVFVFSALGQLEERMPALARWMEAEDRSPRGGPVVGVWLHKASHLVDLAIAEVVALPLGWFANGLVLIPLRRRTLGFFASRQVFTGAGTVEPDGRFVLSEKALGVRTTLRRSVHPDARGIFEPSAVLKGPMALIRFDLRGFFRVLRRRQRLQVGFSDSNLAQSAEYLKVGTTMLVLDMFEAGALDDAPELRDPVAAVHAFAADPTLAARAPLKDGTTINALQLQRFYLERAKAFLDTEPSTSLSRARIVDLWEEALDRLEVDPGPLVGRIDWVTKRWLMERQSEPDARKKVDLRYHELPDGYFKALESAGAAPRLTSEEDERRAITEAPSDTPAYLRSEWIRRLGDETARVEVDWESIRIGGRLRGKVIDLREYQ